MELTGSVALIGQWRGSTVAALTCVCIAEPQPGNTRSILMTSPTPTLCSRLPLFAVETSSLSHSERKEQASVKEQELARKRRGRPWANREGESFSGGRRRVADSASGLGLAHTYIHRKRRGEGILLHIVKTSAVHCSAAIFSHIRSKSSHAVWSFVFLDFSLLKWGWGILWTGKWAAGAGVEYFSN